MSWKKYNITNETVAAMLTASNLTPGICETLGTTMQTLMTAFEEDEKYLVREHRQAYKELLLECRALLQEISADVNNAGMGTKVLALQYQEIIERKLR